MSSSETRSRKRDAETIQVAGQPEAKRTKRLRVSWACAECRRKKERCDGIQPVCGSCKSQDRDCSYVRRPKKRGLTTGYVRGLETLLGLIFHSVEGCEHSVVAILKGESPIVSPSGREDQSASTVNALVDAWRNSPSWKELERILLTVESGEDEEFTARDLHDRLDEALKRSLSIKMGASSSTVLSGNSPTDSQPRLIDYGSTPEVNGSPARQSDGGIPAIQTGPVGILSSDSPESSNLLQDWPELLDVYFANTNSWIPIVLKNDAFRAAYTLSTEPDSSQADQLPLGDQACLLAMLAYARYTQCITIGKNGCRRGLQNQFANIFAAASQLVSHYESRRDVGYVQAMLVFTLLHYAQGNLRLAWSFVGKAVYYAVELGLLKSDVTQPSPLNLRNKRVVLSCFVLETLLSSRLQRRPYMRTPDVQSVGLLDADGIEEWEPWRPVSLSPSSTVYNLPRHSQQPARVLSTFNLLVQASTMMNDNLQGHIGDVEKPQRHLDILHRLQTQDHLNNLITQSGAHEASPQSVNIMLATVACLPHLLPTSTDAGHTNFSLPSKSQANRILASVAEVVKQQRAFILSPVSEVYLNLIENRNENSASAFSHEVLDSTGFVRDIRAGYNKTWRTDFETLHSPKAKVHSQAEPMTTPNVRLGEIREDASNQPRSETQCSTMNTMSTAANGATFYPTRAPSAFITRQPEGVDHPHRAPPSDAPYTDDSRSPLLGSLDPADSRDLFSSLVSLENDDRSSSGQFSFLTEALTRPVLSQEFVENLGVLGDFGIDSVEFQNLFTG